LAPRPLGGRGGGKPASGRDRGKGPARPRGAGGKGQPGPRAVGGSGATGGGARRTGSGPPPAGGGRGSAGGRDGTPGPSRDRAAASGPSGGRPGARGQAGDRRQGHGGGRPARFASKGGGPETQRPRAPAEKRRAAGAAAKRSTKQARRRDQLDAARDAVRPGPDQELIEGRRPVIEALRAGRPVARILLAGGVGRGTVTELLTLAEARGVMVETVPRSLVDATAETEAHQGVLAVVAPIEPISLDELLAIPLGGREPPFFLACDGVEDPRNLGALARSADAAGCHGMILPRHRSAPLSAVAVKASAGALQHLPVAEVPNLARAVERLRASGIWCIGLDEEAETGLFEIDLADEPVCVVVGGEGAGLHRLVREACDVLAAIPMSGQVGSLNASVAGALALFEVRRRRANFLAPAPASR
jgi:23S rRNA (guanosine2251-2'-O)-methyltransferase